jgi:Zn-dependent peptidase ImmA (M78 family)
MDFDPTGTAATLCERDGIGVGILLNHKNSIRRLAFDLAHELYHVVATESKDEERLADVFAAQLLLPAEEFLGAVDARRNQNGKISFGAFFEVIREFGVSLDAAVWRLSALSSNAEQSKVEETIRRLRQAWRESEDSVTLEHPPKLPDRYVALARQALMRGLISVGHYAKCLGISRNRAMADQGELLEIEGDDNLEAVLA